MNKMTAGAAFDNLKKVAYRLDVYVESVHPEYLEELEW